LFHKINPDTSKIHISLPFDSSSLPQINQLIALLIQFSIHYHKLCVGTVVPNLLYAMAHLSLSAERHGPSSQNRKIYSQSLFRYCCDQKSWAAYAQSFAPWQQATIEFTCHDHSLRTLVVTINGSQVKIGRASTPRSLFYCLFAPHIWCCSSRTSRSWWITQSTQHHRRGCNSTYISKQNTCFTMILYQILF